jgi:predicted Zn finger-like uncharacterized protein
MKVTFACPSCAAAGSVDETLVGKRVRCKHCGHQFAVPNPGDSEPEVYGLEEPPEATAGVGAMSPSPASVFVSSRGEESNAARIPRKSKAVAPRRPARERDGGSDIEWPKWLLRVAIAAVVVLAGVALLAPRGVVIAGCVLMIVGSAMLILGFAAGAYGAFSEDVLYGLLYLAIPLYTAYYLVTRWDDLWVWCVCSTAGVALALTGIEMVRWAGAAG